MIIDQLATGQRAFKWKAAVQPMCVLKMPNRTSNWKMRLASSGNLRAAHE